jgi:hypothetical protein
LNLGAQLSSVLELMLFVLSVGQLGHILCEYSAQSMGSLGAWYCSRNTIVVVTLFMQYCGAAITVASGLGFHPGRRPYILLLGVKCSILYSKGLKVICTSR